MTFAAAALIGLTMGQPLGADYHAMNSRNIKLPIDYKKDRKSIRHVVLYVARNGENTWYQEGFVTPDKDSFVFVAKDDGVYWFKMQIVDLKGNKDPAELTSDPPDLKMVVDTTAPQVRVTNARRTGDEIVVEWSVDDKFPDDTKTKVQFRAANNPNALWQDVTLPANARNGVRFPSGISDGVTVKITAVDVAKNVTEITHDFPAPNANASVSLKETPISPAPPAGSGNVGAGPLPPPQPVGLIPIGPTGPGLVPPAGGPAAPIGPGPLTPQPPAPVFKQDQPIGGPLPSNVVSNTNPPTGNPPLTGSQPLPSQPPFQGSPPLAGSQSTGGTQPLPTVDPRAVPPASGSAIPAGGWNGGGSPTVELTRAQVINYPKFDLGFNLEQRGPSGISRVDLWVTRDDGRSWSKWSQHDGKGGSVGVVLDAKENPQVEGTYGFRLVPVSGAGLSEREPVAGDAPDMRVVLDVTPPQLELFAPVSDPNALDTLVIQWKASDRNFGDDPITLEWSDSATGPWKSIATNGNEPVIQANAREASVAKRLANSGQYAWRVPVGVPARVYLKATARDAAGNVKEIVTREPILVDLTKPRAKINGIVPSVMPRQ
ncbi:Uncharacterized protein OS=Blastopirellula marina DSM 3645 GN=DSM3645_21764 PE=4 SV=1 [Gemmata massiliana]|uniref:Ser-Thr-rich glycosyl-phosphatidyl-inositol-anchored membrane family protein n=1 Tax=Gemmata massiliana TaxID=1210884 RepID=A0A6P2D9X4_9BACT|nr:hypothetical protein [Gemmata massiliana]VTR96300.1 Uncharacterized protein OS=Blastopirellula marina DSM 3645 GN=DSM3645_21764 PE=4 SV=1 [Gemmata massiliana]